MPPEYCCNVEALDDVSKRMVESSPYHSVNLVDSALEGLRSGVEPTADGISRRLAVTSEAATAAIICARNRQAGRCMRNYVKVEEVL